MLLWILHVVMNVVLVWGSRVSMFCQLPIFSVPPVFGFWAKARPGTPNGTPAASPGGGPAERLQHLAAARRVLAHHPVDDLEPILTLHAPGPPCSS